MKKRIIATLLALILACGLGGCSSAEETAQISMELPENGIVAAAELSKLMGSDAVATVYGSSGTYHYEWTVFGSDVAEAKDVNLQLAIEKIADGEVSVSFSETQPFGFSAFLSIRTGEKWGAEDAEVYQGERKIADASLSGSKETVINLTLNEPIANCTIRAVSSAQVEEPSEEHEQKPVQEVDEYLSAVTETGGRVYSDGKATEQDKYLTDPIPEGKPVPVEPEDAEIDTSKTHTCTFSIDCATILNNMADLDPEKVELVPADGTILATTTVTFSEGESVFDVLQRVCIDNGIHMEASWTPMYNSAYVEGIHNLYEFDCGNESGWMYSVNGWYPNYGCSRYQLAQGDTVQWRYTCQGLGKDVGCDWMG